MPYAKMVIENIIEYKHYEPDRPEELESVVVKEEIAMPNLIGMSTWDAINELEKLGMFVETQGSGNLVISQFPKENVSVVKGGVVMIECY